MFVCKKENNIKKIEGEKIAQDINKRVDTIAEKVEKI